MRFFHLLVCCSARTCNSGLLHEDGCADFVGRRDVACGTGKNETGCVKNKSERERERERERENEGMNEWSAEIE